MVTNLAFCVIPAILILIGIRKLRERSWGYCKNKVQLNGKVAIVTGANCGIGYEVAKELASRNASVILACRNMKSAKQAIDNIQKQLQKVTNLRAMQLDLASLKSIKQFASEVQELYPEIHLLINNAGVAYPKNQLHLTEDNFEIHMGVNHLGHFYLTNLLLETIKKSAPSRIIIVSSALHEKGKLNLERLAENENPTEHLYADSKLANVYFCRELAEKTKGSGVNVYGLCPGWVYTNLFRHHSFKWYHIITLAPIFFLFMRSSRQGAQTVIYCATEPSLDKETGLLYRNCGIYNSKVKFEESLGAELWEKSESLIRSKIE